MTQLIGHKGGSASTPVEAPDSLHSVATAKILDLLCEGPIQGLAHGLQSVYLNETPLANADGTLNFERVAVDVRTGTQEQEHIAGFPAAESEIAVGVELRAETPWVRALTNTSLSAVRVRLGVPQLQQSQDNGDVTGYRIEYAIDVATDDGAYQEVLATAFDGKTTSAYARSHRVDLPRASKGWSLRIRRTTPNRKSARIADAVMIQALTEVIDAKLRYPMSALVGIRVDARQFSGNVPSRAYDCFLKIIKVPSNYDPATRTYTGVWDGTFKPAWSDNPAWVFYDLVLNDRFGLGHRINAGQVDKWALYEIAQYCDVMVSDGKGGLEPRFTVNVYIQARAAAYKVLQDLAAVFRGMAFYAAGSVVATADMPRDPVYTYTAANVIDGRFTMTGSARSARYTSVNVSWNDPKDFYRAKVAHVEDAEGLARYGDRLMEISPLGCTSEGQAIRAGQWVLLTSRLETQAQAFSVGLDGFVAMPGQIVRIADPKRMGRRNAGRIRAAVGRVVTLDKAPTIAVGDKLTIILPSAVAESRAVVALDGDSVTVDAEWSQLPAAQSVWSVDNVDLVAPLYRVQSVRPKGSNTFDIAATQHEPGKFPAIDNGARISPRPTTVIPPSVQPPPAGITIASREVLDQGIAVTVMTIAWAAAPTAIAYVVEWRRDNGEWVRMHPTGSLNVEVAGAYAGAYTARVRAQNAMGVLSSPMTSAVVQLAGNTAAPPAVTALTTASLTQGIALAWGFPTGPNTIERTEIWCGATPDRSKATKLSDFAYPQAAHRMMGLAFGVQFFFWARLVDRSGNSGAFYPDGAGVVGTSSSSASEILDGLAGQIARSELAETLLADLDDASASSERATAAANRALAAFEEQRAAAEADRVAVRANADALDRQASQLSTVAAQTAQAIVDQMAQNEAEAQRFASYTEKVGSAVRQVNAVASRVDGVESSAVALRTADSARAAELNRLSVKSDTTANQVAEAINIALDAVQRVSEVSSSVAGVEALAREVTQIKDGVVQSQKRLAVQTAAAQSQATEATRVTALSAQTTLSLSTQVGTTLAELDLVKRTSAGLVQDNATLRASNEAMSGELKKIAEVTPELAKMLVELKAASADADSMYSDLRKVAADAVQRTQRLSHQSKGFLSIITRIDKVTDEGAEAIESLRQTGAKTEAAVTSERTARATAVAALSQRIDTLTATADGASAAVQTVQRAQATADGKLSAMYGVKVGIAADGKQYMAGFGAGVENTPSGMQTQVYVLADRFAILNLSNGVATTPFVMQNGQAVLDKALIGHASIGTLQLAGESVTIPRFVAFGNSTYWTRYETQVFSYQLNLPAAATVLVSCKASPALVVDADWRGYYRVYVDGVERFVRHHGYKQAGNYALPFGVDLQFCISLAAGNHTISGTWQVNANTAIGPQALALAGTELFVLGTMR